MKARLRWTNVYNVGQSPYHRHVPLPPAKREAWSSARVTFLAVDRHYVLASWRQVGIAVWIDDAPVDVIQAAQYLLEGLALEWPEGIAFLQVIGEENQSFEGAARGALRDLLRASRGFLRLAPVVYEGTGFRAAALRAIVTGLFSQHGDGFSQRVYSSIDEAAMAIGRTFEKREPARYARELCEALGDVRDRHQRDFPAAKRSFIRYRKE